MLVRTRRIHSTEYTNHVQFRSKTECGCIDRYTMIAFATKAAALQHLLWDAGLHPKPRFGIWICLENSIEFQCISLLLCTKLIYCLTFLYYLFPRLLKRGVGRETSWTHCIHTVGFFTSHQGTKYRRNLHRSICIITRISDGRYQLFSKEVSPFSSVLLTYYIYTLLYLCNQIQTYFNLCKS